MLVSFSLAFVLGETCAYGRPSKAKVIGSGAMEGGYHFVAQKLTNSDTKTIERNTGGAVTNLKAIANGEFSVGIVQSDIIESALKGEGSFQSQKPVKNLRAVARLYPEYIYLIVDKNAPIRNPHDLKGLHVGLGSAGSGTLDTSLKILKAYDLKELDVHGHYGRIENTITSFKKGQVNAFFFVTSSPTKILHDLYTQKPFRIIPIDGKVRNALLSQNSAFAKATLDGKPYGATNDIETISVTAQLITNSQEDPTTVYKITKSLWEHPDKLDENAPSFDLTMATNDLSIPLHPGAAQYYRERNILKDGR